MNLMLAFVFRGIMWIFHIFAFQGKAFTVDEFAGNCHPLCRQKVFRYFFLLSAKLFSKFFKHLCRPCEVSLISTINR